MNHWLKVNHKRTTQTKQRKIIIAPCKNWVVLQWLAAVTSPREHLHFESLFFLCEVCMFSPCQSGVFSMYSGFLPQSKDVHIKVRVIGDSNRRMDEWKDVYWFWWLYFSTSKEATVVCQSSLCLRKTAAYKALKGKHDKQQDQSLVTSFSLRESISVRNVWGEEPEARY